MIVRDLNILFDTADVLSTENNKKSIDDNPFVLPIGSDPSNGNGIILPDVPNRGNKDGGSGPTVPIDKRATPRAGDTPFNPQDLEKGLNPNTMGLDPTSERTAGTPTVATLPNSATIFDKIPLWVYFALGTLAIAYLIISTLKLK
jgi:hypothetical protein